MNDNSTKLHNGTADTVYYDNKDDKEEQYIKWRKEIGFENANLPALDSLSYWSSTDTDPTDMQKAEESMQCTSAIQDYMSLPMNITYIQ